MNFNEMYNEVKNGKKARRKSWKEGEFLTYVHQYLVHNTPYFHRDIPTVAGSTPLYYYVVEKDDPVAEDWETV